MICNGKSSSCFDCFLVREHKFQRNYTSVTFLVSGSLPAGSSELTLNLFLSAGNTERDCSLVMSCYSKPEILCAGELFR